MFAASRNRAASDYNKRCSHRAPEAVVRALRGVRL